MADNQRLLQVSAEQRNELELGQSRSLPAGDVFRARLILALADGLTYREIERKLGASAPTVSKWKGKVRAGRHGRLTGPASLQGRHQGSKPRRATPAVQARVIRRAQQKPSDGSTHWSCRKLSEELGVSKSTVQRILARRTRLHDFLPGATVFSGIVCSLGNERARAEPFRFLVQGTEVVLNRQQHERKYERPVYRAPNALNLNAAQRIRRLVFGFVQPIRRPAVVKSRAGFHTLE